MNEKVEGVVNFVVDPAYTASQKNDPSALMLTPLKRASGRSEKCRQ